jgi:ribonuclease HI
MYIDGSCLRNPGPGAYAIIELDELNRERVFTKKFDYTTNNRMELLAFIHSLELIEMKTHIFTDSTYVFNGYNTWLRKWRLTNWNNGKVSNVDLWKTVEYNDLVSLFWVKAHSDNYYNNKVDRIARSLLTNVY